MGKYIIVVLTVIAFIITLAAGNKWVKNHSSNGAFTTDQRSNTSSDFGQGRNNHLYASNLLKPLVDQPIKEFTLIAIQTTHSVTQSLVVPAYTFNGLVPGPEIRVNQGDFVRIKLINSLGVPITIHWHGYPVLSAMDGVPKITQDPVEPGETFIYEFHASAAGTYWYYSPITIPDQIEGRLYGSLIVQPNEKQNINRDYTLFIEEWGPKTAGLSDPAKSILAINGRITDIMQPLTVNKGETVRLRLINAGRFPHGIHVPGQILKITSIDASAIANAPEFSNQVVKVHPGERIDVEFTVTCNESFIIDSHEDIQFASQIKIPLKVLDGNNLMLLEPAGYYPVLDYSTYGLSAEEVTQNDMAFTDSVNIDLTSKWLNGNIWHLVSGKPFVNQKPIMLEQGSYLKIVLTNSSQLPHAFHIHGHRFTIISLNQRAFSPSIQKDNIYVNPGDTAIIGLRATNPGTWLIKCPIHGHGETSQLTIITYKNYVSNYYQSSDKQTKNIETSQQ